MVNDSMEFYFMYRSRKMTELERPRGVSSVQPSPRRFGLSRAVTVLGRGLVAVGSRLEKLGSPSEQTVAQELVTHA